MRNADEMQISKKVAILNIQKENIMHVYSITSKKSNYKQNGIPCTLTFYIVVNFLHQSARVCGNSCLLKGATSQFYR
jgi:hypothetical protein